MDKIKRVLFIEPKSPGNHVYSKTKIPRLGLPLLATLLKERGYDVRIYIEDLEPNKSIDFKKIFAEFRPNIVGISSITSTVNNAYKIADLIKRNWRIPIMFGGAHVTFLADEALAHGDFVIRKEGENTLTELLDALNKNKPLENILGLSYKKDGKNLHNKDRPPIIDLDSLPIPDLKLIHRYHKIKTIPISTSRGCPYGCKFCAVIKMFDRAYRFNSPERVIEELKRYPDKNIFFVDDNFAANLERTKKLLRIMIKEKININWSAQVRTDAAKDDELLKLMKKAGCLMVYIGFESINPETLKEFKKQQSIEDIKYSIRKFHQYEIGIHGMFVVGAKNDTKETIRQTAKFAKRMDIDTIQFMMLTPLPGTETFEELDKNNRIFITDWSKYDAHHAVFIPEKMTPYELQYETIRAMAKFYSISQCLEPFLFLGFYTSLLSYLMKQLIKKVSILRKHKLTATPINGLGKILHGTKFYNTFFRIIGRIIVKKTLKDKYQKNFTYCLHQFKKYQDQMNITYQKGITYLDSLKKSKLTKKHIQTHINKLKDDLNKVYENYKQKQTKSWAKKNLNLYYSKLNAIAMIYKN